MAATPQYGVAIFKGVATNTTYSVLLYNVDVAGSMTRWDAGAGLAAVTSGIDFRTFTEPVILQDLSVTTGIVDTKNLRVIANGVPTTHMLNWATHLNTLNQRPALNILFNAGTRIQLMCSI